MCFFLSYVHGEKGILINGIRIEPMADSTFIGQPGEVVNLAFRLTNETEKDMQVDPEAYLPDDWRTVSMALPLKLSPQQKKIKIISVHIPQNAMAGFYKVELGLKSIYGKEEYDKVSATIEIRDLYKLHLEPAIVPDIVSAGDEIEASFLLRNLGNSLSEFWVKTENCQLESHSVISLEPGESIILQVRSKTVAAIEHEKRWKLTMKCGRKGSDADLAYTSAFVRIIPKINKKTDQGHLLPVVATVHQITRRWQNNEIATGLQGELYAIGTFDEAGAHRFEMRLRGPDRFGFSALGQFDEYFAHYENGQWSAHIGDKSYSLSLLTDFARYGRGLEANYRGDRYEIGGYIQQPRFFPGLRQVAAGYMNYKLTENFRLFVNGMQKIFAEGNGQAGLGGVGASLKTSKGTTIEAEASFGQLNSGTRGSAFMARLNSTPMRQLLLAANFIYADKFYPGYYNNTTSFYGQANYRAGQRLNFNLLVSQDGRNASQDTLFAVSPFGKVGQVGVFYDFQNKLSARAYYRLHESEDRMVAKKFHYQENLTRLQLEKNWEHVQLSLTNEFGEVENLLSPAGEGFSKTNRWFVNGSYHFYSRFSVGWLAQFHHNTRFGKEKSEQWIFGGNVSAVIFPFSRLYASFQTNYQLQEYYRNRNLFDLRYNHRLGKHRNHEMAISANYTLLQRTEGKKDFAVQTSYSYHFGLRTGKKKSSQGVFGQLINKGGCSISGVAFSLNGRTAVTDEAGRFFFEKVAPGKYYLMLDPSTIALHEVTDVPLPMELVVEEGVDMQLEIGLTKAASISGIIDIEPASRSTNNFNREELPKMFMVEISNGKENFRRIANKQNYFDFPDVRPGTWKLRIINPTGYEGFYFKESEWEFDVPPGLEKKISIKLLRKRKMIKFQQKLSLTSAGG